MQNYFENSEVNNLNNKNGPLSHTFKSANMVFDGSYKIGYDLTFRHDRVSSKFLTKKIIVIVVLKKIASFSSMDIANLEKCSHNLTNLTAAHPRNEITVKVCQAEIFGKT